ncbi:MAG: hypothetical protein AB2696_01650 [Candidatus Thiodiazotropha sp.]|nr:hypothetical protein [Candidatus Thiodiazotropha sp. (ex Lucina pensylvanica)]
MGCTQNINTEPGSECSNESTSVSKFSPSPVKSDEQIARQIFTPIHIDTETGKVKPAAFTDAEKGMSTNRLSIACLKDINLLGEKKAEIDRDKGKKDREFIGLITANVGNIRAIQSSKQSRQFCIFDTAKQDDQSHADVCQILTGSKGEKSDARRKLMKQFTDKPT